MEDTGKPKVEVLYDGKSILSEGPVYDKTNNELIWVDIDGKTINFLNVSTKKNRSIVTDDRVGAAVPCLSGKRLIASIGRKLVLVDRETGQLSLNPKVTPTCKYPYIRRD